MTSRILVVGLGPAGAELVNRATLEAVEAVPPARRFLRTVRHPAAELVAGATSFDDVYDTAASFDDVYATIADRLVDAASAAGTDGGGAVLYAVPGSPAVLERSVELLRRRAAVDPDLDVEIVPAMSFVDLAWARLGVDPVEAGARLVDGHLFAQGAAGERGPLLVAHCHSRQVLSDVKLSVDDLGAEPGPLVTVLQRLGTPDEAIFDVGWADLDRSFEPDHLTALWIPEMAPAVATELVRFDELVHTLRRECPWDREQTHESLKRHLLEEAHEVIEAIDGLGPPDPDGGVGDVGGDALLEEELGDLLFQVVFHSTLAGERGAFTLADVARGIHDKLVSRHPHVFGEVTADDSGNVLANWEEIKRAEKGRESVMDGIPAALPALARAEKVQRKAARTGLEPAATASAWDQLDEALVALRDDPVSLRLGDLLFAVVRVARLVDLDPEDALRDASRRFEQRIRQTEDPSASVSAGGGRL